MNTRPPFIIHALAFRVASYSNLDQESGAVGTEHPRIFTSFNNHVHFRVVATYLVIRAGEVPKKPGLQGFQLLTTNRLDSAVVAPHQDGKFCQQHQMFTTMYRQPIEFQRKHNLLFRLKVGTRCVDETVQQARDPALRRIAPVKTIRICQPRVGKATAWYLNQKVVQVHNFLEKAVHDSRDFKMPTINFRNANYQVYRDINEIIHRVLFLMVSVNQIGFLQLPCLSPRHFLIKIAVIDAARKTRQDSAPTWPVAFFCIQFDPAATTSA